MAKYGNASRRGRMHAVVVAAGRGKAPSWSTAGKKRKQHMLRVADLMGEWAEVMGLRKNEIVRWRAAGLLHDVVRDTPPHELRPIVPEKLRDLPGKAYHGPAATMLLAKDGVDDEEFLHAIRWHTLGSKSFGRLGKALYAADFLEPGRLSRRRWREGLRERAPRNLDRVLREIVGSKIDYIVRAELPVHRRTVRFWNSLVENP
ncbi:MAG: HD domain-containing protein [Longimicrobiales bacterium]